jgi:hypothetical protein
MSDIINHIENEKTGEKELWITIKDASDLLSISERHAWNIISEHAFATKKLLNQSRKKTYVKQADIEKYHKDEQERQRLEALKPSPLSEKSEMSEKDPQFEMSESLSESGTALSESGTALSERPKPYLDLINELRIKQETLQKGVVKWRVTALWVSVLGLVIAVMLGLYLNETKKALSERENSLSESRKALSEMSERAFSLSEREKEAIKTISDKENYIRKLEENIPKPKLEELQTQTKE